MDPKKKCNDGRWICPMCGGLYRVCSLENWERIRIVKSFLNPGGTGKGKNRGMGGGQALKRIHRIKFPQRHPKPSPSPSGS